nr:immunoglobulin heavy chain junction region [Macaca mulatta]
CTTDQIYCSGIFCYVFLAEYFEFW